MPAKSKKQQRFFAMVKRVQEGLDDRSVPKEVREVAADMSEDDVADFASTKHKDLPEQVDKAEND